MKLNENVLKRVRIIERKYGIKYADTNSKLYKALRVMYSVIGLYSFGINLMFILGMLFVNIGTDNFKYVLNSLITVSVCTLLIVAGYILSFFKIKLTAGIMSVIPQILLIFTFGNILRDDLGYFGFKDSFYWRHLIPLVLMIVFITWTTAIAVRARVKTEKQYKKVIDNLYNQFNIENRISDLSSVSEEQWNEFLENYDPYNYKMLFKQNKAESESISD